MWLLLAIVYFTSRLDMSPVENMSTGALSSAIQDIIISTGYSTKRISFDLRSSLVTAVQDTSEAVADLEADETAEDHQDQLVTAQ